MAVDRRRAVLQLLRGRVRAAARPAHGDRAARRLAAGVAPRRSARTVAWPGGRRARGRGRCSLALGAGSSPAGLVGYTFAAFVLAAIVLEFVRGTRARKALGETTLARRVHVASSAATGAATAATSSTRRSCCSSSARSGSAASRPRREAQARARRDDGGRRLHAHVPRRDRSTAGANANELPGPARGRARRQVARDVTRREEPLPRRAADVERGRRSAPTCCAREDLFVIADQFNGRRRVVKVLVNPLVNLIWLAGSSSCSARSSRCGRTRASSDGSRGASPSADTRLRPPDGRSLPLALAALLVIGCVALGRLAVPARAGGRGRQPACRPRAAGCASGCGSRRSATGRSQRSRSSSSTTAPARSPTRTTGARRPAAAKCGRQALRRSTGAGGALGRRRSGGG